MPTAVQIIEQQVELIERLRYGKLGDVINAIIDGSEIRFDQGSARINKIGQLYGVALAGARAYRVQENMLDEIARRAQVIDRDSTLALSGADPDDQTVVSPPGHAGFLVFEEPFLLPEEFGDSTSRAAEVHALTWVPTREDDFATESGSGYLNIMWTDARRSGASPTRRKIEGWTKWTPAEWGDLMPIGLCWYPTGYKLGDMLVTTAARNRDRTTFAIGETAPPFGAALWRMLGETVPAPGAEHRAELADEHVPRTRARAARRAGLTEPGVTTVVLRRERRPEAAGTGTPRGPQTSRMRIEEPYVRHYWIGSEAKGTRRRVARKIQPHWTNNDESLPTRQRRVVRELRR